MIPDPTQKYPARYEIQVAGRIAPERADWFDGMTSSMKASPDGGAVTVLSGRVADQAALFGILNRIRDLGLRLISVNPVGD
jgi:hypothetical protein